MESQSHLTILQFSPRSFITLLNLLHSYQYTLIYFSSIYFNINNPLLCFIVCLTFCHVKQTLLHKVCCYFIFLQFYGAGWNPPIWRLPSHMLKRLEGLEIWHLTPWLFSETLYSQYSALRSPSERKVKLSAALLLISIYKDTPGTSSCF